MKNILQLTFLILFSFSVSSCGPIKCGVEAGLLPSANCSSSLGRSNESVLAKMVLELTNENYNGFYYYDHGNDIDMLKSCVRKFYKKKKIDICSHVSKKLDRQCFDSNSIYACQYLYELQDKVFHNPQYKNKIIDFTKKNNIYTELENNYYFPRTSLTESNVSVYSDFFLFPFNDYNHDGIITKKELIKRLNKIDDFIFEKESFKNKDLSEKFKISELDINVTLNLFESCNKKVSVLKFSDIDNCNIPQSEKDLIKSIPLLSSNSISPSELFNYRNILGLRLINEDLTNITHNEYINKLKSDN